MTVLNICPRTSSNETVTTVSSCWARAFLDFRTHTTSAPILTFQYNALQVPWNVLNLAAMEEVKKKKRKVAKHLLEEVCPRV